MSAAPHVSTPRRPVAVKDPMFSTSGLLNVVALAILAGIGVALWLMIRDGGWDYYRTPLAMRGMNGAHRALRPSGGTGQMLGIAGTVFLLGTLPYVARKRIRALSKLGSTLKWLEFHIFCGVFGPVLITFHTSFKFNGLISVAYWSMILVMLSGFVGRYLFVRIPKTIRGKELSGAEIDERARELKGRLAEARVPAHLLGRIEAVEAEVLAYESHARSFFRILLDEMSARRKMAALRRELRASGIDRHLLGQVLDAVRERAVLLRRIAHLKKTKQLFQMWHVFHRPLVWVMFGILSIHLAVAIYFGYALFWR